MSDEYDFTRPDDFADPSQSVTPSASVSVLDDLRASINSGVEVPPLTLQVPNRKDITLVFNPSLEFDLLRRMIAASTGRRKFDELTFSIAVISHTNSGIRFKGEKAYDSVGDPLSVRHRDFKALFNTDDTRTCIQALFGNKAGEGHIMQTARQVLAEAGYGEMDLTVEGDVDPLD